jgi:hypothetical protein
MLAAALLASLLAQAEQAPAPSPPTPSAPVESSPAASPAPAPAPAPPAAAAPATPAPPSPPPAAAAPASPPGIDEPPPPPPANSVSVHVRYAYRLDGDGLVPKDGLSLGGEFERRMVAFQNGLELGVATNFFYDRFTKDVVAGTVDASGDPMIAARTLSQTSFALMETTGWRYADMRLFVAVGGGLTVGYFASPDLSTSSTTDVQPFARAVFGFDFAIAARTAAVLRVDYSHNFFSDTSVVTTPGMTRPLFGDLFDAGIGFLLRF